MAKYQWKAYRAGYTVSGSKEHAMQQVRMGHVQVWMSLCGVDAEVGSLDEHYREERYGCQRCARLRLTQEA